MLEGPFQLGDEIRCDESSGGYPHYGDTIFVVTGGHGPHMFYLDHATKPILNISFRIHRTAFEVRVSKIDKLLSQ